MAKIPAKPTYTHGSTGTEPSSSIDYANGDPLDSENLDYYLNIEYSKIKGLIDWANAIDSNDDNKVDAADTADSANTASLYKNNDIDSNGDGKVDSADTADNVGGYQAKNLLNSGGFNLTSHDLAAGEFTALTRVPSVPSGTSLRINSVSVADGGFNTPAGLNVIVYDVTNATVLKSYNTAYSSGQPLNSISVGGIDLLIAVDNGNFTTGTGSKQSNVTAHIGARFI